MCYQNTCASPHLRLQYTITKTPKGMGGRSHDHTASRLLSLPKRRLAARTASISACSVGSLLCTTSFTPVAIISPPMASTAPKKDSPPHVRYWFWQAAQLRAAIVHGWA